jgi:serine/threonine-protein kinase
MADHEQTIPLGETIGGKYRVERLLGAGGMGFVVAATNLALGTKVALKFVRGVNGAVQDEWRLRLQREAQVAASLTSPHVARVHDFGEHDGLPYLVMEHLTGRDLAARLEEGPIAPGIAAGLLIQACEAIGEAHSLGIVHRDLKPQNLFLMATAAGGTRLKVLDFGIAKRFESLDFTREARGLTQTGTVLGSPLYMSPEQLTAPKDVDRRSDIWALGVILYEMLAGQPPFDGNTLIDLSMKICTQAPVPVHTVRDGIPEEFSFILERCLQKNPEDRFSMAEDLAAALFPLAAPEALGGPGSTGPRFALSSRPGARSVPVPSSPPAFVETNRGGLPAGATVASPSLDGRRPSTAGDTARAWEGEPLAAPRRSFRVWPFVAGFLLVGAGIGGYVAARRGPSGPASSGPASGETPREGSAAPSVTVSATGISVTALPAASERDSRGPTKPPVVAPSVVGPSPSASARPVPSAVPSASAPVKPATGANGAPVITD